MTDTHPHQILTDADRELLRAERLLEVAHVAHRLSISMEAVRRLVRKGSLIAIRLDSGRLRFESSEIDRFINARRTTTNGNNSHTVNLSS